MRFLLILIVALTLTLAWQSSVIADVSVDQSCIAAEDGKSGDGKKPAGGEEEEPECD